MIAHWCGERNGIENGTTSLLTKICLALTFVVNNVAWLGDRPHVCVKQVVTIP